MQVFMRLLTLVAASLWLAGDASALVNIDWVVVGDPGNACDPQMQGCLGAVANAFKISKYEVTNAQYAEFLNAKGESDTFALWNSNMSGSLGGITRSGSSPNYVYSTIAGREDMPVVAVSFYSAMRFANWLQNGQGLASMEDGAYTLLGGTAVPSNGTTVTRNVGAQVFIPTEDEWYKAAYYDPTLHSYYDYPAETDTETVCALPTPSANSANCASVVANVTVVGSYAGSPSPNGTFDQGGNVDEWTESIFIVSGSATRAIRGGWFNAAATSMGAASVHSTGLPQAVYAANGFRVAGPATVTPPAVPLLGPLGTGAIAVGIAITGIRRLRAKAVR